MKNSTYYKKLVKENKEFLEMLKKLTPEQKIKVEGIVIGMKLSNENKAS